VDQKIRLNERSGSVSSSFTLDDNPVWHQRELHSSHTSFDTPPFYWNSSFEDYPSGLYQHKEEDEINDAMLPSSLNDLFTPLELHSRRVKQEGYASMSESPLNSTWRVPFITKNDWLDGASNTRGHSEDEDVQFFMDEVEGTHQSMEDTLSFLFQNKIKMHQNNNIHHGLL
jgi:hypothetical protein